MTSLSLLSVSGDLDQFDYGIMVHKGERDREKRMALDAQMQIE